MLEARLRANFRPEPGGTARAGPLPHLPGDLRRGQLHRVSSESRRHSCCCADGMSDMTEDDEHPPKTVNNRSLDAPMTFEGACYAGYRRTRLGRSADCRRRTV